MPTVRVAVCTNRAPAAVVECLEALALQGGGLGALLVASGLGAEQIAAHERSLRDLLPGAAVVSEPTPGLSRARNRALQECVDDDVIAFVDDDAVVGPGWLRALHEAWDAAEPDVACIGGPIRPRFPAGRPEWLTDALLPGLTVLDRGSEAIDLDPAVSTVYGANISFRVGPLRVVGGFDPGYGHSGSRVWFSEEDEAQRALARVGGRVRYAPGPWVWHVIPPGRATARSLLRRRFAYGATLGARGARSRALALRQGLRSALGAPVAAARGRRGLATERAVRAAENAGVLLGPLVARR